MREKQQTIRNYLKKVYKFVMGLRVIQIETATRFIRIFKKLYYPVLGTHQPNQAGFFNFTAIGLPISGKLKPSGHLFQYLIRIVFYQLLNVLSGFLQTCFPNTARSRNSNSTVAEGIGLCRNFRLIFSHHLKI